jgi:hypothetical protein
MELKEQIVLEIDKIPESYLEEVYDFLKFLQTKSLKTSLEPSLLSEEILKQDWLRPEEEEAWKDL